MLTSLWHQQGSRLLIPNYIYIHIYLHPSNNPYINSNLYVLMLDSDHCREETYSICESLTGDWRHWAPLQSTCEWRRWQQTSSSCRSWERRAGSPPCSKSDKEAKKHLSQKKREKSYKEDHLLSVWVNLLTGSMPNGYGPPKTPLTLGSNVSKAFVWRVLFLRIEKKIKMIKHIKWQKKQTPPRWLTSTADW